MSRLLVELAAAGLLASLVASCGSGGHGRAFSGPEPIGPDASVVQDDGGGPPPAPPCLCAGTITVTLHVVDSLGNPVASPTFQENGRPLKAACSDRVGGALAHDGGAALRDAGGDGGDPGDAGDAMNCSGWSLWNWSPGAPITVSAPGYKTAQINVMVPPLDCCGGASVNQSVTLHGNPFACGAATCADGEYCITPCCGGPGPQCFFFPDASTCPAGYHYDVLCSGNAFGCRMDPCTPPPPFCSTDAGACPSAAGATTAGHSVQCNCP